MHHGDTFDLPESVHSLATTKYNQAIRQGCALGVQFHPEATAKDVREWSHFAGHLYHQDQRIDCHLPNGVTPEERTNVEKVVQSIESCAELADRTSRRFFNAWWQYCLDFHQIAEHELAADGDHDQMR